MDESSLLSWHGEFNWTCEKWEEDAVEYARKRLERECISEIQDGYMVKPTGFRDRIASAIAGRDVSGVVLVPKFIPIEHGVTSEHLRRIVGRPDVYEEIAGNILVNEGIQRLEDLLIGAGGTPYNAASAFIGVGSSSTAEASTQTELQAAAGASTRFYKGMNATYPSRALQTVSWQSDFTTTEANFAWNEWTVASGATSASGSGFLTGTVNLNRKVVNLGTKTTGTWTLTGQLVVS